MIGDKILVTLKDINEIKDKLRELKKEIKGFEKIEDAGYLELKRGLKDLKEQVKDFEENFKQELSSDNEYHELRELKVKTEEELAQTNAKLFEHISQLPPATPVDLGMDTDLGYMKVQILPAMRVYVNGKEEKPR